MFRLALLSLLLFSAMIYGAPPNAIELFIYWNPDVKEGYPLDQGDQGTLTSRIRKKLLAKGQDLWGWDLELYRPEMLHWRRVTSWSLVPHWFKNNHTWETLAEDKQWVFWSLGADVKEFDFSRTRKENLTLFLWEPPTVEPEAYDPKLQACFGKIFTWDDDLVDGKKFFKFQIPITDLPVDILQPEQRVLFAKRKLCTMIASRLSSNHPKALYKEREKVIRFFEDKPGEFDLYGRDWEKRKFKNYRGKIADKILVLKQYKFSICYENTRDMKGYITEKIFDCFFAGCVPVYWGASNIEEYIPENCFIDRRRFRDESELYGFLRSMDEETYQGYLERITEFLRSEKMEVFSFDRLVETFVKGVS
jgi:hypothetical protein